MPSTRQKGNRWERVAESFLRKHGLKTLKRNFHGRFGEIDLVMLDQQILVFAEVRYRENSGYGSGAETVTWTKQKRICSAAGRFLQRHSQHSSRMCRFDVISIGIKDGQPVLNWIRNAFEAV